LLNSRHGSKTRERRPVAIAITGVTYLISVSGFLKPEYIHYLICRNYSITLTIKCKELLTKAKMLRHKLTLTIYETWCGRCLWPDVVLVCNATVGSSLQLWNLQVCRLVVFMNKLYSNQPFSWWTMNLLRCPWTSLRNRMARPDLSYNC